MTKHPSEKELLDQFDQNLEVEYRGERYLVRDNGAVCRQRRPGKRKRPLDDKWTFGNPDRWTGYMTVSSVVVHRVVATAFHGEQPSEHHVVDHIDTNCRNNRAENLRWVTRLENILLNPITLRRIVIAYGSLEAFFDDPAKPENPKPIKNWEWMRTVSKGEAQNSRDNLHRWVESGQPPKGRQLGDWLYGRPAQPVFEGVPDVQSRTTNAMQRNWKTPNEFPACPGEASPDEDPLETYWSNLTFGTVFARSDFGESVVVDVQGGKGLLSVICHLSNNSIKGWGLAKVTVEGGKFIHENIQSFFELHGALKRHCNLLGLEFGRPFDDYC